MPTRGWRIIWGRVWQRAQTGLGSALAVNFFVVILTLPFLSLPSKSNIRAMGWAEMMFGCAIVGLVYAFPQSWRQLRAGQKLAGLVGMVLSLTPFPLAFWVFHLCAQIKQFVLEP